MSELDMNLTDLAAFCQVVDSGGFTAAGRVLKERTKQISRRVKRLEDAVGLPLLHRTTRSVSPTESGRRLYIHASRILNAVSDAARSMAAAPGELRETLRVAVPTMTVAAGLAEWSTTLQREHPHLTLAITVRDGPADVVGEGLDLCITSQRPAQSTLLIRRLGTVTVSLAAHVRYIEAYGIPQSAEELVNHRCLLFASEVLQTHWDLIDPQGHLHSVPVRGALHADNSALLFEALHAGAGVGLVPPNLLIEEGEQRGLKPILPGWSFAPLDLYAVSPPARRGSKAVDVFIEMIRTGMRDWWAN
ncbi:MAG: LysR family transcriptional regulator [Myxococcota bacterium]